jgi:acetoacetate decarboxylase
MCDVARLQREVVSAARCIAELTLGLGEVVFEHLNGSRWWSARAGSME